MTDKPKLTSPQRPHKVSVLATSHHGEIDFEIVIECPYAPGNYDKPCRLWSEANPEGDRPEDDPEAFQPGCFVKDVYDAVGWSDMTFEIPPRTSGPWDMFVMGSGDEGPRLTEVSLVDVDSSEYRRPVHDDGCIRHQKPNGDLVFDAECPGCEEILLSMRVPGSMTPLDLPRHVDETYAYLARALEVPRP